MGTFSDNLLLSMLAFGESAANGFDNWGESANFNFGRLDAKLGNKATISLTAGDVTLSANAEASLFLEFTGTLSGDRIVNVSNRRGFWMVSNATTGDHSVMLLPSGGTGVEIPSGTSLVYSDGSSVALIQSGGGEETSEVIYQATNITLNQSGSIIVNDIPVGTRELQIQAEFVGLTANAQAVAFNVELGDGSTWSTTRPLLLRWMDKATNARRFFATVHNLDDPALSVVVRSAPSVESDWLTSVLPSEYAPRPISALRFRITPVPSTTTTLTISRMRIIALRS